MVRAGSLQAHEGSLMPGPVPGAEGGVPAFLRPVRWQGRGHTIKARDHVRAPLCGTQRKERAVGQVPGRGPDLPL